jgi:hypothetical protein
VEQVTSTVEIRSEVSAGFRDLHRPAPSHVRNSVPDQRFTLTGARATISIDA